MRYVPDGAPRTPGGREVACAAGRPAGRSVERQQPPPVRARAVERQRRTRLPPTTLHVVCHGATVADYAPGYPGDPLGLPR